MGTIKITLQNGKEVVVDKGISVEEFIGTHYPNIRNFTVACKINNRVMDLRNKLVEDVKLDFISIYSNEGLRIYQNSLVFLLILAARDLYGKNANVWVHYSLSKGLFCEVIETISKNKENSNEVIYENRIKELNQYDIKELYQKMQEFVKLKFDFVREDIPIKEALHIFNMQGQYEKVRLFSTLNYADDKHINVYRFGNYFDYFYGPLVPNSRFLKTFELKYYPPGLILRSPDFLNPREIPPFEDQKKIFQIFYESSKWSEILEINNIGNLNQMVLEGKTREIIRVAEALHEKKLAKIADEIYARKDFVKVILIAGPSSSGKTTFSKRLITQLKVNGLNPIAISLDNYFVDRSRTPRDENGNYDYEALEAIDVELFNSHLLDLLVGKRVEMPIYNFHTGTQKRDSGEFLQIKRDQPIIIEGIHGLNDKLTEALPGNIKYKIYVSALTQINIDSHNRVPTTDTRIIRRMVRDSNFRGHDALATLRMWRSVRRGEEKYIFPFQEQADVMFNSALIYELAVLKKYALKLLEKIPENLPEYAEAYRLQKFLNYFLDIDEEFIPPTSILREFIGGSTFDY